MTSARSPLLVLLLVGAAACGARGGSAVTAIRADSAVPGPADSGPAGDDGPSETGRPPDAAADSPPAAPPPAGRRIDYSGSWTGTTSQGRPISIFIGGGNTLTSIALEIALAGGGVACTKMISFGGAASAAGGGFEVVADRALGLHLRGTFESTKTLQGSWDPFLVRSLQCGTQVGAPAEPQPAGTFTAVRAEACNPATQDCAAPTQSCQLGCGRWAGYRCDVAPFMPRAAGEICYSPNDCERGYSCAQLGGLNRCFRACVTDAECPSGPCTPTQIECGGVVHDTGFGACRGTASYDARPPIDLVDADASSVF